MSGPCPMAVGFGSMGDRDPGVVGLMMDADGLGGVARIVLLFVSRFVHG